MRPVGQPPAIVESLDVAVADLQLRDEAREDRRIVEEDGYVVPARNDAGSGAAAMRTLLRLADPPTAVLATTDVLAMGALHGADEAGWNVPRDVSIVGFDDIPMAAFAVPALTTVRMPVTEMAIRAVDLAVDQAEGGSTAPRCPQRPRTDADDPPLRREAANRGADRLIDARDDLAGRVDIMFSGWRLR